MFYLVDSSYSAEVGKASLSFMDESNHLVVWKDSTGHVPYLLSTERSNDPAIKSTEVVKKFDGIRQESREFFKFNVTKPTDVFDKKKGSGLRDRIKPSWENDIRYPDCFVYDRNLTYTMPYVAKGDMPVLQHSGDLAFSLDRAAFAKQWSSFITVPIPDLPFAAVDIEVLSEYGESLDPEKAEKPVIAFSLVSPTESKVVLLSEVHDERILLDKFFSMIEPYHIIVTFFGDEFDLPYLFFRSKKLETKYYQNIYIERGKGYQIKQSFIRGKIHLDLFKFFNNSSIRTYAYKEAYGQYPGLGELGKVFLGKEKAGDRKEIPKMTPSELTKYSLSDSEITYGLGKKAWPLICLLARICRMPLREVCRQRIGSFARSLFYSEERKLGYLIPSKEDMRLKNASYTDFKNEGIEGAYIFDPVEGFHEKVFQLDVSSLYPSMIDLHNIGFETVECTAHDECKPNIVPYHGFHICTRIPALLSIIVGTLKDIRIDMKLHPEKYAGLPVKDIVGCLKILTVTSFGVFGDDDNEALYVRMVAEAITAYGRDCIIKCSEIARNHNATVLYGDTDSLLLRDIDRSVVEKIAQEIHEKLHVSMEIENEYRYFILHRKKNYLGVTMDGQLVIKGLLGKKKHVPLFIRNDFTEITNILRLIQSQEQFSNDKSRIEQIAKNRIVALRARAVPLEELAFTNSLSKDIQHGKGQVYEAARYAISQGLHLADGTRALSYVLTTGERSAKPLGLVRQDEVNVEGYLEHYSSYIGNQLLEKIGINFDSIISGDSTLEKFFIGG